MQTAAQWISPQLTALCQQAAELVVSYAEEYERSHCEFAGRMWPTKRRRSNAVYNRWKFRGKSVGPVEGLLLCIIEGKVVGQLGLIPATVRIGEELFSCQWACDLMVDSSVRRKGIGSLLLASAISRDVITLGSNPSAAADVTMARVGFKPLNGPRIMVLPLKMGQVLRWKTPKSLSRAIPFLSLVGQPLATLRCRTLEKAKPRIDAVSCRWQDVIDFIAARQATLTDPHVCHGEEFLRWRCSGLVGLSPELRAIKTTSGGFAIVGAAPPYFYVYDWSASEREDFIAIFHLVYQLAREAGSETIQALAQDSEEETWLKDANFIGLRQPFKIISYPAEKLASRYQRFRYSIYDSDGNL